MRLRHGFAACALAAGCGSVSDNSNNIDAAIVVDTTAPVLMSSAPGNMATKVSVITPISLFFDEALDEATVTSANVKVTYPTRMPQQPYHLYSDFNWQQIPFPGSQQQVVTGTVSYDAESHKISFVPNAPLPYNTTLTLTVTGVKDVAGNMFAGMPVKFATFANSEVRRFFNNSLGNPVYWNSFAPDTNGQMSHQAWRQSTGPDLTWHTPDDPTAPLYAFSYTADGRLVNEANMNPSTDGLYGTADDVPYQMYKYVYDAAGAITERTYNTGPGGDTMWNTADDIINALMAFEYTDGRLTRKIDFNTAGTDTQWRTGDDRCNMQFEHLYDAQGRKSRQVRKNCGADALPKTADDQILDYYEFTYDTNGGLTQTAWRNVIGPDNMWFTIDDAGGSNVKIERDPKGRATKTTSHSIGADNKWNTADDGIFSYSKPTYDAKGLMTEDVIFDAIGPDAMWNTADDVMGTYTQYKYDGLGNRVSSKVFYRGVDGVAKTPDDKITNETQFNTAQ